MLNRTPLFDFHKSANAKMVDFAGWEMPILYRSILDEHEQTRRSGSLFDTSHMGRLKFSGKGAEAFLDRVLTRKITDMAVGQCRYSLVCNEQGGILDDVIISKDKKGWILVCNASNREKVVNWFHQVRTNEKFDFDLSDDTLATAMVAIQGPKVLDKLAGTIDARGIKRYHFEQISLMGFFQVTVFRSGYSGEDGVEIILPKNLAGMAMKFFGAGWDKPDATVKPAGLGARDTLRLEAAMPLYGHELSETTDPLSANLAFAVCLEKDFVGAGAIRQVAKEGPRRLRVGLELEGKRIARQGTPVLYNGNVIGEVTSGTFGPTVGKSIAMAYVDLAQSGVGTGVQVDLKGTMVEAKVVAMPFYKRQ